MLNQNPINLRGERQRFLDRLFNICINRNVDQLNHLLDNEMPLNPAIAERILDDVRINEEGDDSYTLAITTASLGFTECLESLLSHGASPSRANRIANTPLHLAVLNNHESCIELLIHRGANTRAVNRDGYSPTEMTDSERTLEVIRLAIESAAAIQTVVAEAEEHHARKVRHYSTILRPYARRSSIDSDKPLLYRPPKNDQFYLFK